MYIFWKVPYENFDEFRLNDTVS